jgi:hypothetical protein
MNKICCFVFVVCFSVVAIGAERPVMVSDDNAGQLSDSDVGNFLESIVEAFNKQDCVLYSSYFTKENRDSARRKAGMSFAKDDINISLVEHHILDQVDETAEVALAYKVSSENWSGKVVSKVFLEKEGGAWKLTKEVTVQRRIEQTGYFGQPVSNVPPKVARNNNNAPNCQNGRCGVQPNFQIQATGCANGQCGTKLPFNTNDYCKDFGLKPVR